MREHWRSFETLTYDIVDLSLQDISSSAGFIALVRQVCRVRACGVVLLAPVCFSFSWMSRFDGQKYCVSVGKRDFAVCSSRELAGISHVVVALLDRWPRLCLHFGTTADKHHAVSPSAPTIYGATRCVPGRLQWPPGAA